MTTKKLYSFAGVLILSYSSSVLATETTYPLVIQNCGKEIVFNKQPERVVTVGQNSTEIMYLLGLGNKLAATSLWFGPVQEPYKEINKKVNVIDYNMPSFEGIIRNKPDLVMNQFEWLIGPAGTVASYEQFQELSVPVYTSPADCAKDNSDGGDGVRKNIMDINLVYQEIDDISKIFNVQDKGKQVISLLKKRVSDAQEKVAHLKNKYSAVFWFSSADLEMDPWVAGKLGPSAFIANTLGIKNVIDSAEEWPAVGWETIAKSNPSLIFVGEMERRRFQADDWKIKVDFLKKDPVTKLIPAVKENNIYVMNVQGMNAGIRTIDGVEFVADSMLKSSQK